MTDRTGKKGFKRPFSSVTDYSVVFVRYRITCDGPTEEDWARGRLWVSALESADIVEDLEGGTVEFTTHQMLAVPAKWVLERISPR